jgi:hypothetical protein
MKDTNSVAATNFTVGSDAAISFSDEAKQEVKVTLRLPGMWLSAIRLEIVPQATNVVKGTAIKAWKSAALAVSAVLQSAGRETKLPLYFGEADHKKDRYVMGLPVIGVTDTWLVSTNHGHQTAVWLLDKPLQANAGDAVVVNLSNAPVA